MLESRLYASARANVRDCSAVSGLCKGFVNLFPNPLGPAQLAELFPLVAGHADIDRHHRVRRRRSASAWAGAASGWFVGHAAIKLVNMPRPWFTPPHWHSQVPLCLPFRHLLLHSCLLGNDL